jgi:deazaflavin-dependent oxidoreductase (nitroreductase family)
LLVVGRVVVPVDTVVQRASRGRVAVIGPAGLPHLLLTVTGARTGRARQVPLLYAPDGERFVVAASNWGKPRHPAWSVNLLAHPEATVNLRGTEIQVRGRLAEGDERARLWSLLTAVWPGFDGYASHTDREIRVFVLEPGQSR